MNGGLDGVHAGQAVDLVGAESGGWQFEPSLALRIGVTGGSSMIVLLLLL